MLDGTLDALSALHAFSDPLAWLAVALFLAAVLAERAGPEHARRVGAIAWGVFGVFWLSLFPTYYLEMHSVVESVLSLAALPACLYAGYLLYDGRDSLRLLTRAVAFMGIVYLPFETVPLLRRTLIEAVTVQTYGVIRALGYEPALVAGPDYGYASRLVFTTGGQQYATYVELACTGVGSMAIFGGLVAAVDAPLGRKLRGLALAVGVIWVLNIARNVFIAVAFGKQYLQLFVPQVTALVGYEQPGLVSFFLADRVVSQSLSVVALVGVTFLVARQVPELYAVIEDVLYLATGTEYDLRDGGDGGSGGDVATPRDADAPPVGSDGD